MDSPCLNCRESIGLSTVCLMCPDKPPLNYDGGYAPATGRTSLTVPPPDRADDPTSPRHYARFPVQPLDFIQRNGLDFLTGNVIKYVVRAPYKGRRLEDLRKARVYLDRMIDAAESVTA